MRKVITMLLLLVSCAALADDGPTIVTMPDGRTMTCWKFGIIVSCN